MNIRELLKIASKSLIKSSTPDLDSRILMCFTINYTYEKLLLNYEKELSPDLEKKFFQLIARRKSQEPIAYITGEQEFFGLNFIVNRNVLIPRPDTELLVETIIDDYKKPYTNKEVKILELGTGSGAISIALAIHIATSQITALDISDSALKIAKENAKKHNVSNKIKFIKSNWYKSLGNHKYDYIISNPPYISQKEKNIMTPDSYLFEPNLALFASDNGIASYKIIIKHAKDYLYKNGKLLLEIGYTQKETITALLKTHGFCDISTKQDLSYHDRVIIGTY